jgi:hypothetical protein
MPAAAAVLVYLCIFLKALSRAIVGVVSAEEVHALVLQVLRLQDTFSLVIEV